MNEQTLIPSIICPLCQQTIKNEVAVDGTVMCPHCNDFFQTDENGEVSQ